MSCNCGGSKAKATNLTWSVSLTGMGQTFEDGTTSKSFATIGEANAAIAKLGLLGKVRPTPGR